MYLPWCITYWTSLQRVQAEYMVGPLGLEVLGFFIEGQGKIYHFRELTRVVGMND